MKEKTYPYTAFDIAPSGKVREVTLVAPWRYGSSHQKDSKGSAKHNDKLFDSKRAAIEAGIAECDASEEKLTKSLERLRRKRLTLKVQLPDERH